jgi:hypothetical protein
MEILGIPAVIRWLVYVFLFPPAFALGAFYMTAPLLWLAVHFGGREPLTADPVWGPVLDSSFVVCCGILVFGYMVWPRLRYLAIHEKGFVYRARRRRHVVPFEEISRCLVARDSIGLTLVLRDSTRLRLPEFRSQFPQEEVGQLVNRINEHMAERPPCKTRAAEGELAAEQSPVAGKTAVMQSTQSEIRIPNPMRCYSTLVPNMVIFGILLSPTIFVAASLYLFFSQMDVWGIITSCLFLLTIGGVIYGLFRCLVLERGGYREFCWDALGFIARKYFLESSQQDGGSVLIRYGFQLFGHRYIRYEVPLDSIETVAWPPEQAPLFRTVYIDRCPIGPSRLVDSTEGLGLRIVEFLCRAGAGLVEGRDEATYVRAASATGTRTPVS